MKALILILLLTGCATTGILKGSGEPAPAPYGYEKLCKEQPTYEGCTP